MYFTCQAQLQSRRLLQGNCCLSCPAPLGPKRFRKQHLDKSPETQHEEQKPTPQAPKPEADGIVVPSQLRLPCTIEKSLHD